jgi:hypothetical protein
MLSDTELDIATIAYLRARGWTDEIIEIHSATKDEVRGRMKAAMEAVEKFRSGEK